jgi:hypothetical protein
MNAVPVLLFALLALASCTNGNSQTASPSDETQYLMFQVFVYNPSSDGSKQPFNGTQIRNQIDEIRTTLGGTCGDGCKRQIGFTIGPLSLDHTDDELRTFVRESFRIALEKSVAVAFHIDDSMFWINRPDLWQHPANVEWSDWAGSIVRRRYIDWAPVRLAPQMCYNSPTVRQEIKRIAKDIIGAEVKQGIEMLKAANKEYLFAGVIAGWETHLADLRYIDNSDSTANRLGIARVQNGYHALTNLGYTSLRPPANIDSVLERVVSDHAAWWAMSIGEAGVPANRIYTHIAVPVFPTTQIPMLLQQFSIRLGFTANLLALRHTTPATAFNQFSRAGFSTYPVRFKEGNVDGVLAAILTELSKHGNPRWASSEGTNVVVGANSSEITWDEYLSGMFRNGAAMVTIFAWSDPTIYGQTTRSTEAVAAYKKFLNQGY